jgi:hypothetical protein
MGIQGAVVAAVLDDHGLAIAALFPALNNFTIARCLNGCAS